MRLLRAATFFVCCASLAFAQDQAENLCGSASVTTVDHDGGVTVQKVTLSGKWGGNEAIAYLPEKKIADGAIVFSHSAIHADNGASVDLLVFALTLARAGAAVIVPKRTLTWMPQNRSTNREGAPVTCAGRWLVDHARVFNNDKPTVSEENIVVREGYGYVGPRLCDPAVAADCKLINENEGFCRPRYYHCPPFLPQEPKRRGSIQTTYFPMGGCGRHNGCKEN